MSNWGTEVLDLSRLKDLSYRTRPATNERTFTIGSCLILLGTIALLAGALLLAWHRVSLPDDRRGLRLLDGTPEQGIQTWDTAPILAVEGQPATEIMHRALTLSPQPPTNWQVGETIHYTIQVGNGVATSLVLLRESRAFAWHSLYSPTEWLLLLIGLGVFLARPHSTPAKILLLTGTLLCAGRISMAATSGWSDIRMADLFSRWAFWPTLFLERALLHTLPLVLHFFLIFPTPKAIFARSARQILLLLYGGWVGLPLIILLVTLALDQPLLFFSYWNIASPIPVIALLIATSGAIGHSLLTRHSPVIQAQIRWVAWGVMIPGAHILLMLIAIALIAIFPQLEYASSMRWLASWIWDAFPYTTACFPLGLAVAILRYRLFDIDLVINRTLVYGALTALVAVVYLAIIAIVQGLLLGLDTNALALIVAITLLMAAILQPVRRRMQAFIDQRFFRSQVDMRAALATFSREIRTIIELPDLLAVLANRTADLLKLHQSSVLLRQANQTFALEAMCGTQSPQPFAIEPHMLQRLEEGQIVEHEHEPFPLLVPLLAPAAGTTLNQLIGILALGIRRSGQGFSSTDRELLRGLADQAGTAIRVAQLVVEQRTEANLREEAERQLEQHRFSPAGQAEALAAALVREPDTAIEQLHSLAEQTTDSPAIARVLARLPTALWDAGATTLAHYSEGLVNLLASSQQPALLFPGVQKLLQGLQQQSNNHTALSGLLHAIHQAVNVTSLRQIIDSTQAVVHHTIEPPYLQELMSNWKRLQQIAKPLRSAEQIDRIADQVSCYHEAHEQLQHLPHNGTIATILFGQISQKWQDIIAARLSELEQRAQLTLTLLSRRVWYAETISLRVQLHNYGLGQATQITIIASGVPNRVPTTLASLAPGEEAIVELAMQPGTAGTLSLQLQLRYTDAYASLHSTQISEQLIVLPAQGTLLPLPNPYIVGVPLQPGSALFVGRSDLLEAIQHHLSDQHANHLVLIGQRRTGKTSLLRQLPLYLDPTIIPVYLDGQALGLDPGLATCMLTIATEVGYALEDRGITSLTINPDSFRERPAHTFLYGFLPQVRDALGLRRLVLLLDEFEALEAAVKRGTLDVAIFEFLRHLIQHTPGLTVILCGTHRLEELAADYWSALFNLSLYRHVGFLEQNAAFALVTGPVAAAGMQFDDLALDAIWRITAGHPYFIQLLCHRVYTNQQQQQRAYVTHSDVLAAVAGLIRQSEAHFNYLWAESDSIERSILQALSTIPRGQATMAQLSEQLAILGYPHEPTQLSTALRHLVVRDILEQTERPQQYRWKLGLLGQWIKRTQSVEQAGVF